MNIYIATHYAVQITLKLKASPRDTKPPTRKIWLYSKADLTIAKQLLKQLPIASTGDNIDVFWRKWLTVFMDAMNRSIPSKSVPIKSATPWINRDIRTDITKRERMFRKAKRSNSQDHLSRYRSLRNSIVSKIREAKKSFFEKLSQPTTSNRKFWSIVRSVNPRKPLSTGSLSYGSVSVTSIQDKANLLNEFFSASFNSTFVRFSYTRLK